MISEDSRFNYSARMRVVNSSGVLTENERVHMPYPREPIISVVRSEFIEYKVRSGDTWNGIAARVYRGRSDLWWVIAEFSGVIDPFKELVVGKTLIIPTFDTVMFEVLDFQKPSVAVGTKGGAE